MTAVLLELPTALRSELKEPMGRLYTDAGAIAADAGRPLVAVGDIVTYHLLAADRRPDVALIDDRTERAAVDPEVREAIGGFDRRVDVTNPPATITESLVAALLTALERAPGVTTLVAVDGEEDLAALPAILALSAGGSVVYGQPGAGMVLVDPDAVAADVRELIERMDGDAGRALDLLGAD